MIYILVSAFLNTKEEIIFTAQYSSKEKVISAPDYTTISSTATTRVAYIMKNFLFENVWTLQTCGLMSKGETKSKLVI